MSTLPSAHETAKETTFGSFWIAIWNRRCCGLLRLAASTTARAR
jgi:hypothetical protein